MVFSGCIDDDSFGPAVHLCRDDFDFTIKFEQIFLGLIPNSVFIAIALTRIVFLVQCPVVVRSSISRLLKLTITVIYAIVQLSLLVLCTKSDRPTILFVSSCAASFASAVCIIAVSYLEHARSPRPSTLLSMYLILSLIFDIAQTRTLWLASVNFDEITFTRLFNTATIVKAVLIPLELQQKSKRVLWDTKLHSPEETSGIFSLGAFLWLNQIFLSGYSKILTLDDLFPLDHIMTTGVLQLRLIGCMEAASSKGRKFGLAIALAKTLAVSLLLPIGPRVALTGFRFCQPFLVNTLLDYLQRPPNDSSKNVGYGLIGATILIYIGIAISTALYWYFHERTLCMCRGALAGAIYKKTTEAKLSAAGDSDALTLMSTDVERIRVGFLNLHEFWANSIEVGLATWLVQRQLGAAFVAPLIVVIICIICGAFVNRFTGRMQKDWMERIQKRVGLTANVISNMKHLRISGLTIPVEDLIQQMRVDEFKTASRFRIVYVIVITLGYAPTALAPVMTFAFTARTLDISTIFTSMSFLILLADPLGYLFQNSPHLIAAFTCLDRIQAFLDKDTRVDFRVPDEGSVTTDLEKEISKRNDKEDSSDTIMNISEGNFGWAADTINLKNVDLDIRTSKLTMIVGCVTSGKSTLCKVLLGEVPVSRGQVIMKSISPFHRVGYCDQTPFLSNSSIRENIISFSPFNYIRYREVIEATMLEPDFLVLPQGDESKVGSNGITLSGGQRQRVSMARALYLDTNFLVFDDILSGLDADTEEQVFCRVFGPDGLLRRRNATVILCTHSIRHLPSADHIVALAQDGSIVEQGTFHHLISNKKYIQSLGIKKTTGSRLGDDITPAKADQSVLPGNEVALPDEVVTPSHVDEKARMLGDYSVHRHYFASLGKISKLAFLVCGFGWGFSYNWGTIWLQYWSKNVSSAHPSRSNSFYIGLYALSQTCYLGSMFFCFIICFTIMIQLSGAQLHKAALNTVVNAPLRFFTKTDSGIIINLFSQDMTLLDNELPIAVTNLALDVCNAIGMAAVIASSSPFLAISYPFIFIILYSIQKFYLRTSRQLRLLDLEAKSPLYTHFLDTIKGIATFRAFGWVVDGIDKNNRLLDMSQRPTYLLAMVQRWLGFALQLVVAVLAVVVVSLATQLRSSTGLTGASLVTLMTFGDVLNYIIRWWTQIETSIGAVSRLKGLSEKVKSENLEGEDLIPPKEWPLKGTIQIRGVSASYDDIEDIHEGSPDRSSLAIKNLSLFIKPGEKVAICGRSGSGKSSIILLLLRLLDPLASCSENITIDDTPLHKIDRRNLRQRIIAVPQDPVFLPDGSSFKSNLDVFNISAENDCRSVLETVGLWAFVDQRGGLAECLIPDTLSQGQKQLFSLARAILRRRIRTRDQESEFGTVATVSKIGGILLLDEVSSSVDQDSDRTMQRIIKEEFKNYTIVMVSHRLEMAMDFDTVFVMDNGSVAEIGQPRKLIETEGSRFKDLWMVGKSG